MLIDTHCHLNFKAFRKDLDQVVNRAKEAGIIAIIIPGAKIDSSKKAVEIAIKYQDSYAAVGIHPHHVSELTRLGGETVSRELTTLSASNKVVAVGEIGLDYHRYTGYPPVTKEEKAIQEKLFILQLELARKTKLPVIIHCRDAYDDTIAIISSYASSLKGVVHCFEGEKKHLRKIINIGFFVGFDGNCTYPENARLKSLIHATPLDALVLETDAPFLTPIPFRGRKNEPSYIVHTADKVAEIQEKTVDSIEKTTIRNACMLFRLKYGGMLQ